ncbi:MAG: hypothetical protein UY50_C0005G0001 [Parcubacteria group bacterium GW2011_GWA2_49_9]|nr:MAG: hypothetical protein UY50_C0005G0001 [Parcubacteria group bacterium GW2011_GWA2_49_9]
MTLSLDKVLITGTSSMIGRYVNFGMQPSREELDITNGPAVFTFVKKVRPCAILHLAALTDMRYCEEHPDEAMRVNAESTETLAKAAKEVNAKFVYVSTNAVFDGSKATPYDEDDVPSPSTVYGKSKFAGETAVKKYAGDWLVVRTSRVFGGGKKGDKRFVGKIISQLQEPEIRAIDDCLDTPTYGKDVAQEISELMKEGRTGIVHVTNSGIASRFLQAKYIADFFGYRGRLTPVRLKDFELVPPPLRNEALVSKTVHLRSWQEALSEYLKTEW